MIRTSIVPGGSFRVGIHTPSYAVANLRQGEHLLCLGVFEDGAPVSNEANFTRGDVQVASARTIYEIPNPFPFRGCTYVDSEWAAARATNPMSIARSPGDKGSMLSLLQENIAGEQAERILEALPRPVKLTLAQTSDNPDELMLLARQCCSMTFDQGGMPTGLLYARRGDKPVARISDHELFETIANNPFLPDIYKEVMVLRPGVQGGNEIVGNHCANDGEVFEYLRANSYIAGGHYAANFAHNSIRYRINDLSFSDIRGVRHLYYQRTYMVVAEKLGLTCSVRGRALTDAELEAMRQQIAHELRDQPAEKLATLWGWNFGYDFSGSGYRLHASHQMIHQQYAMVPELVATTEGGQYACFACGDMVADTVLRYRDTYQSDFFADYIAAIRTNSRVDRKEGEHSLIVWEDDQVLLFVPKAQVSQWELQLMVIADTDAQPVGNIVEADADVRNSLDKGLLIAQQVLAELGAELVTSIEFSKRLGEQNGQRLLYSLLPKLPWSMGAFSEAQSRYICGHYPEDFASACRTVLKNKLTRA